MVGRSEEVLEVKTYCRVYEVAAQNQIPLVLPVITRLGLAGSWSRCKSSGVGVFEHTFEAGDPRIARLRTAFKEAGLEDWLERHEATFTDDELRASLFLELELLAREKEVLHEATAFDINSGCPTCRTGSTQIRPLKIRPSTLPKKGMLCQTLDYEYLVAGPLYETLAAAELTGLEFMPVVSTRGNMLPWWQIMPRHVMPRMAPEQRGWLRDDQEDCCANCERDGWAVDDTHQVPQIAYRRSELAGAARMDVAETWECQGIWDLEGDGRVARGRVLVSQKVFGILKRFRVPGLRFTPVLVVND